MTSISSILSASLYQPESDLKILLNKKINIETIDHDICNKYAIYKFNQYIVANAKDCNFGTIFKLIFGDLKQNILICFMTPIEIL